MCCCNGYDIIIWVVTYPKQKGVKKISKLADVRKNKGLSQAKLAEMSGVHRVTIARFETGASTITAATARKLASALGVAVDDII